MSKRSSNFKAALIAALVLAVVIGFGRYTYQTPILMYHYVDTVPNGSRLHVTPKTFQKQMEFLKVHGYRVMPLWDYVRTLKAGKKPGYKTVVITFDDGYLDNFSKAFPVLKELGLPATIFMITGHINKPGYLHEEDLRILDESTVITIGAHTVNHAHLPDLTDLEKRKEIFDSKTVLEKILGHPVTLLSYPAGGHDKVSREYAREAGFEGAVSTNRGPDRLNPYALHRLKVGESGGNLFNFWLKISGYYHLGKKRIPVA